MVCKERNGAKKVYKAAACGAAVGATVGVLKGGAIGVAAVGTAFSLPLWGALGLVGGAAALGVSALVHSLKEDSEEDQEDDPEEDPEEPE